MPVATAAVQSHGPRLGRASTLEMRRPRTSLELAGSLSETPAGATRWHRPWRKSQAEVRSEVEAANQILLEGQAASIGIDAGALRFFFLAQDALEDSSVQGALREEVQLSLDRLRQAATNAATKEEIHRALQGSSASLAAAGIKQSFDGHPRQDLCHQVLPQLLLGGWAALQRDCGELRKRRVTHVVSVVSADQRQLPEFIRGHLHIHSFDSEDCAQKLAEHFPKICQFIDSARGEGGVVYVHCGAGISRAPTATASYVMWKFGVPAAVAVKLIRAARPCIRPNVGFVRELRKWEKHMKDLDGYASGAGTFSVM